MRVIPQDQVRGDQPAAPAITRPAPAAKSREAAPTAKTPEPPLASTLPSAPSDVRRSQASEAKPEAAATAGSRVGEGLVNLGSAAATMSSAVPDLVPMKTQPRRELDGEITGHLKRQVGKRNLIEPLFVPDDRRIKPFVISPKDAEGIAEGGRVTIIASPQSMSLASKRTEQVRSAVGRVDRDKTGFVLVGRDEMAPYQRTPLDGADESMLGKTVLAHVENPLDGNRRAEVREVFGDKDQWRIAFTEVAARRGVDATFSRAYAAELDALRKKFDPNAIAGYVDMTDKPFITIDNPYSKDFDQAMYIEPSPTQAGAHDVYYAIADPAYFFKLAGEGSLIAERARRLQTTTYMPGVDMPILDRPLSEELVSLIPNANRPAVVLKYTVGATGEIVGEPTFIDGVVKSRVATNYVLAQDFIDGKANALDPMLRDAFTRLKTVGGALLAKAKERGMITSPLGERWATIDKDTGDLKLERRGMRWIEEANAQISITSNALMGEYLVGHNAPAYHRVHKAPDADRVALARQAVNQLGVEWPENVTPSAMLERLAGAPGAPRISPSANSPPAAELKETPSYRAVRNLVLRSQPRAEVSAEATSHEGLKLAHYVQFTAPMRRERDSENATITRAVRDGKTPDMNRAEEILLNAAKAQERAIRVDREVRDRVSAKALEPFGGKTVKAEVVLITPKGFEVYIPEADVERFVELPGRNRLDVFGTVLHSDGGNPITVKLGETIDMRIGRIDAMSGTADVVPLSSGPVERERRPTTGPGEQQKLAAVRGDGFSSPLVGKRVTTEGVVVSVNAVGFYLQDPADADAGGILVRARKPRVTVGDVVSVSGTVRESRDNNNQYARTLVELVEPTPPRRVGRAELPNPVDLATLGAPPADAKGATEYWRKLLGRLVSIPKGTAISPSNRFGDLVVLPETWSIPAERRSRFGGILHKEGVENFTKASLKFREAAGKSPPLSVGAVLGGMTGIVSYRSGDFQIELTKAPEVVSNPSPTSETTRLIGDDDHYIIASVNMLNLNPMEAERGRRLAKRIVESLKSPDVISVQEIQDNDGPTKSEVVAADKTFQMMIRLIKEAGGPEYEFIDVPPVNGKDGGEPGGNIRCGFLWRKDRVSHDPKSVRRLGEGEAAFMDSRKSVVARFSFKGQAFEIVNDHFASRRGSTPWNSAHAPIIGGAEKRLGQGQIVRKHIEEVQAKEPNVDVFMVGDMNDTLESPTVKEITKNGLANLSMSLVEPQDRFDYNYRGTQQILCPVIGTPQMLAEKRVEMQYLHANSVSPLDDSDHDHAIMRVKVKK